MQAFTWQELNQQQQEFLSSQKKVGVRNQLQVKLAKLINTLDGKICSQLNAIITQEDFQRLHMAWLGLHYLCQQKIGHEAVRLKILSSSWTDLKKMLLKHAEFEASPLFNLIYSNEFDMPGGKPFGLLVGDYYIDITKHSDVSALTAMGEIAAVAFAPFVTSINPAAFGINEFAELDLTFNAELTLSGATLSRWQLFRQSEAARFVSLVIPRVLYDTHYHQYFSASAGWQINRSYWGHPGYALAAVISQSYCATGWFLAASGLNDNDGLQASGIVPNIRAPYFNTDQRPLIYKYATDVFFTEAQEHALLDSGLIPVCSCRHTGLVIFNHLNTAKDFKLNLPEREMSIDQANSLLYLLCVCRFAHYLKIIGRDKIGSTISMQACEQELNHWLSNFIASNTDINLEMKLRYPLQNAKIRINADAWKKKAFLCQIELGPHGRTAHTVVDIVLQTTISAKGLTVI